MEILLGNLINGEFILRKCMYYMYKYISKMFRKICGKMILVVIIYGVWDYR